MFSEAVHRAVDSPPAAIQYTGINHGPDSGRDAPEVPESCGYRTHRQASVWRTSKGVDSKGDDTKFSTEYQPEFGANWNAIGPSIRVRL